jgi:hypothetical protein
MARLTLRHFYTYTIAEPWIFMPEIRVFPARKSPEFGRVFAI